MGWEAEGEAGGDEVVEGGVVGSGGVLMRLCQGRGMENSKVKTVPYSGMDLER